MNILIQVFTTILILLLAFPVSSVELESFLPDKKVTYKQVGDTKLKLHVFNPENHRVSNSRPAIVFFFGGGWNTGNPKQFYPHSDYFSSRGMVAISVEYRVAKQHNVTPKESLKDAKSSIRWIREHANQLGIDPNKLIVGGGSAGGHLAAATATIKRFNENSDNLTISSVPNALVLFNPVYDNSAEGYGYDRVKDYWKDFSPMHNLDAKTPPTIVFLGSEDPLIPVSTAQKYCNIMKNNNQRCELNVYPGKPHGFFNFHKDINAYKKTIIQADQFLASLGYIQGEPKLQEQLARLRSIVPQPQSLELANGNFQLTEKTTLRYPKNLKDTVSYFQNLIESASGKTLPANKKVTSNSITLKLNKKHYSELGDEGYLLNVSKKNIAIEAASETGIFYGLQTIRQLLPEEFSNPTREFKLDASLPALNIKDVPRFALRSFMLDESRYFKGTKEVKKLLDEMAFLKMNTFHWHLIDDAGWRLEIKKYPKLTEIGSKRKDTQKWWWKSDATMGEPHSGYYTQEQAKDIINYAQERHITIIPEVEMPGHASAAIASYPWLGVVEELREVPVKFGKREDNFDVIDPKVINFLHNVLDEVMALFPSKIIHIGGDEVKYDIWKTTPKYQAYMKKKGFSSPADIQIEFTNNISKYIESKGRRMMGWNEIMGINVHDWMKEEDGQATTALSKNAVVQFWKGDPKLIKEALDRGHDVVYSHNEFTYLDYIYKKLPLEKLYNMQPVPKGLSEQQKRKIQGLGCQLWSEWVPTVAVMERQTFPRIAACAEIAWLGPENRDFQHFKQALEKVKHRWMLQGIRYGYK